MQMIQNVDDDEIGFFFIFYKLIYETFSSTRWQEIKELSGYNFVKVQSQSN